MLGLFATTAGSAHRRYAEFMRKQADTEIVRQLRAGNPNDGRALGGDDWLSKLLRNLPKPGLKMSLDELISETCAQHGIDETQLAAPDRNRRLARIRAEIALMATVNGIASISEVARRFGRAQPTLSRAVHRLKKVANKL